MEKLKNPRFDEYLAGAFFSYTLSMIPIMILTFILQLYGIEIAALDSTILVIIIVITNLFAGLVAGYLVVRRSETDYLMVGIKTGIGSILLNGILIGFFEGTPANPLILLTVFIGCTLSGYLYSRYHVNLKK